jgi:transcriptional regulator with XRE-family HTH domain
MRKQSTRIAGIALAICEARLEHGLSQRQLADWTGISAATIRKIERGEWVKPRLVLQAAAALAVLDMPTPPASMKPVHLPPLGSARLAVPAEWELAS